jgi:hypothetical protein
LSLDRRFLICAVSSLALLSGVTSATAKPQVTHTTTHISGVVVAINARRHTLKLRVSHAASQHKGAARAASAGGAATIVVAFGNASVSGPDGAVAVGDDVTVTTDGPSGPTTVAASITVVGQTNGGDSGNGAAVPGDVTAVDPSADTLTLAVSSTTAQGQTQSASVIVTVSPTTILAVGNSSAGKTVTLSDIAVGDHVVVFTEDATADPIAAVGILDSSNPGGDHEGGGSAAAAPARIPGSVVGVDQTYMRLLLKVSDGPLAGQTVTVQAGPNTSLGGVSSDGGAFTFADIKAGDTVVVYSPDPTATPIDAVGIADQTTPPAPAAPATPVYDAFNGVVAGKGSSSVQVTVSGDGPLGGETVSVNVTASTILKGTTTDGTSFTLADIAVGDQVRVYTTTLDPSDLVAVAIGDGPPSSGGSTTPAPSPAPAPAASPAPQRFGGVVTAVRGDGLTVTALNGPLAGQSVIVSVPPSASFQDDPQTGAGTSLATISVGDAVEIHTDSLTGSPIVAVGVTDDGVYADA